MSSAPERSNCSRPPTITRDCSSVLATGPKPRLRIGRSGSSALSRRRHPRRPTSARAGCPLRSSQTASTTICGSPAVSMTSSSWSLVQDDDLELRAATGPRYGRIWNADVVDALVERFGDGVSGHWRVPGIFGERITVDKGNTTLYASDREGLDAAARAGSAEPRGDLG